MSDQVPSKDLVGRIEDCLKRLWIDRVVYEASARGLLREAADALKTTDEPCSPAPLPTHDGGRYKKEGPTHEPPAEQLPSAWIKGHTLHTDAGIEYDEEVVPGSDRPKGDGWHPLYSRPSQPPRVGINGAGEILGCTCQMCEFHRSAEAIERHRRATSTKPDEQS